MCQALDLILRSLPSRGSPRREKYNSLAAPVQNSEGNADFQGNTQGVITKKPDHEDGRISSGGVQKGGRDK